MSFILKICQNWLTVIVQDQCYDIGVEVQGHICLKIVSKYDQEIPQSKIADKPMAPQGRATQLSRDTRKTN